VQYLTDRAYSRDVVNRACSRTSSRVRGTDESIHTVSGFDFQTKVAGRGPLVLQEVGRKVIMFDPETGEETVVLRGHNTLPEGSQVHEVFCAAVS
jgi:hypothetical protein